MTRSSDWHPTSAMVLAAGLGQRMRPLTDNKPKPMIEVDGRPLIDHALDRLVDAGVTKAVVNLFYLGEQIREHLAGRDDIETVFSEEAERLETGGGVKQALALLGDEPFYVANADTFWLNGPLDALKRLAREWDGEIMDGLLMLHSTVDAYGYTGHGDFQCLPDGRVARRPEMEIAPLLFTGVQILSKRFFDQAPEGAFSLNVLYDQAIERERLYGMIHDGEWFHIGTPEGLELVEGYLNERFAGEKRR